MAVTSTTYNIIGGIVVLGGATPVNGVTLLLPQENDAVTPTLAFGDGNTGIYEETDNALTFASAGVKHMLLNGSDLTGAATGSWNLIDLNPTSTQPNICPAKDDRDTGSTQISADIWGVVAGGVLGLSIAEAGGVISEIQLNGPVVNQTAINLMSSENHTVYFEGNAVFN